MLGFTYDAVVDAWQDARLASAIERLWVEAQRPAGVDVRWSTSGDDYAFRWYLNRAAGQLLDDGRVTWRCFVIGRVLQPPESTREFLRSLGPSSAPGGGS